MFGSNLHSPLLQREPIDQGGFPARSSPRMSSNPECSQLEVFREWGELRAAVLEELAASRSEGYLQGPTWRRLLAVHVSNTCRPGHMGGVVESLDGCITHMPTASVTGGMECALVLPKLFLECELPFAWVARGEADTREKAEETCCFLTFLFCLAAGPDLVRLHPSTLRDPDRIRAVARRLHAAALAVASSVQGGMPCLQACSTAQQEAAAAPPAPSAQGSRKRAPHPKFVPEGRPQEAEQREQEVLMMLLQLPKDAPQNPCHLPGKVSRLLANNLPKKTFRAFLERFPGHFTVVPGVGKSWEFVVISTSATGAGSATDNTPAAVAATVAGAAPVAPQAAAPPLPPTPPTPATPAAGAAPMAQPAPQPPPPTPAHAAPAPGAARTAQPGPPPGRELW